MKINVRTSRVSGLLFTICFVLGFILLFGSVGCFWSKPQPIEYEEREVGDFVVWFYEDYCEIYGTTEQGNSKKFLVIPEYIDGVRVDSLGYRTFAMVFVTLRDLVWPRIGSEVLEKIYFERAVNFAWTEKQCPNFKKIICLETEDLKDFEYIDVYFPRIAYENAVQEGKIGRTGNKFPANVSYCYNYENAEKDGYYWIDDCDYGEKIEFIPPEPQREGYTFDGWYKEPECINEWNFGIDTLPEEKREPQEVHRDGETVTEEVTVYQETILYAKWNKV